MKGQILAFLSNIGRHVHGKVGSRLGELNKQCHIKGDQLKTKSLHVASFKSSLNVLAVNWQLLTKLRKTEHTKDIIHGFRIEEA